MQLVDELSMIYTTCLMCYATFSYSRSRLFSLWLSLGLISLAVFITLYYHYLQDPAFHQNAYAILTAIVLFRAMYVMEGTLKPKVKDGKRMGDEDRVADQREAVRDRKILVTMRIMIVVGLGTFLTGFGIWHLDNVHCGSLRRWRREVGLPWGILLEGHGWWYVSHQSTVDGLTDQDRHLMTGTGAYFYITWGIWLRHCLNAKQDEYELIWPRIYYLPEVVRKSKITSNGDANILDYKKSV